MCALYTAQLGLLLNFTLAHYKHTTIPPPHLASDVDRERGTLAMATQTSTHSGLGFCSQSRGGQFVDIVNKSEASISVEAEKVETEIYSHGRYECMERTIEEGK